MDEGIGKEIGIHGQQWDAIHDGYFADPVIAGPLLAQVAEAIGASRPDVLVDLGGGTGFLLHELLKHDLDPAIRLVNVDISGRQLARTGHQRISTIHASLTDLRRESIGRPAGRFLFMMRSVLHYFGRAGLLPLLQHLRAQMRPGELFVHQTACFESPRDADCLNMLYEGMGTSKYYFTVGELRGLLGESGWRVSAMDPAPPLPLASAELAMRYRLAGDTTRRLHRDLLEHFGAKQGVFEPAPDGFRAYLHYKIYTCIAA